MTFTASDEWYSPYRTSAINRQICASQIVNQAAMGSRTSPWQFGCQVMWETSARRVVDFPPVSIGMLPSNEA